MGDCTTYKTFCLYHECKKDLEECGELLYSCWGVKAYLNPSCAKLKLSLFFSSLLSLKLVDRTE